MGLSVSNLQNTIFALETPVAEAPLLSSEQGVIHDLSSALAELPVKGEGPRYFLVFHEKETSPGQGYFLMLNSNRNAGVPVYFRIQNK
jgi:hypothetical protein